MFNHNDGKVIRYEKIADNRNLVTLATAYDHNCSEQETVEVSDAVLAVMLEYEQNENKYGRNQRNHRTDVPTNDYEAAKKGWVMPSADEILDAEEVRTEEMIRAEQEEKIIEDILSGLTKTERRRIYLFAHEDLNYSEIAEREGVSPAAVMYSCRNAFKKLKPHGDFLQNTVAASWLDLINCTNF